MEAWRETHNALLQVAAELGIAGAAIFAAVIVSGFAAARRARRALRRADRPRRARRPFDSPATTERSLRAGPRAEPEIQEAEARRDLLKLYAAAMTASLTGWLVAAMFASVAYYWTFYIVLGLAVAVRDIAIRHAAGPVELGRKYSSPSSVMISVVIATRNRAKLLSATLEAVVSQEPPGQPFEVVVVDDASIDGTSGVVEALARRSAVPVVYLSEMKPGKSHALNAAIQRARGELLVFTDDDVIPSSGWLAAYVRAFSATGASSPWDASCPCGKFGRRDGCRRPSTAPSPCPMPARNGSRSPKASAKRLCPLARTWPSDATCSIASAAGTRDLGQAAGHAANGRGSRIRPRVVVRRLPWRVRARGLRAAPGPAGSAPPRLFPALVLRQRNHRRWIRGGVSVDHSIPVERATPPVASAGPHDLFQTAWGILTWDSQRSAAGEMQLAWFAGYLRGRWSRRPAGGAVQAAAASRGLDPSQLPGQDRPASSVMERKEAS